MSNAKDFLANLQANQGKPAPVERAQRPAPAPEPIEPPAFEREGTSWAADVWWVFNNHSNRVTKDSAGSDARWGLYKYAKSNMDTFMGTLVPKAMMMLEKAREKSGDSDDIQAEERKGIRELEHILTAAIAEASGALG